MKTIRWGLIGCGDVTEVKSGPALYKAAHSELVAVMRRNGELAADYARRHNVARWHDDAEAIIRAPDIDAVYIATTPESHCDYVERAAAAGKAVFVEKPMALDYAQCERMIAACRSAGVPLWTAFYRRALPRFLAVQKLVQDGAIGDVRMVVCREFQKQLPTEVMNPGSPPWRIDVARSGGGYFVDRSAHTLDFLDYMFGPAEQVSGFASNQSGAYQAEDTVVGNFRFASGVFGVGTFCYAADRDEDWNEIIGTKGRLRFSTRAPVPIKLMRGARLDEVEEIPADDPPHVHQPLVETIVNEMNGIGKCPSTGETGARTTWVIDQLLGEYRASMQGSLARSSLR